MPHKSITKQHLSLAFLGLWMVSVSLMGGGFIFKSQLLKILGGGCGFGYSLILICKFAGSEPQAAQLPDVPPLVQFFPSYREMLSFISITVVSVFAITSLLLQNGWLMLILSSALALFLLLVYRRKVTRRMVWGGLAAGVSIALVESLMDADLLVAIISTPMFIAGTMLLAHTQLSKIQLLCGNFAQALKSFLWGCVLALPPAMLNITLPEGESAAPMGPQFDRWWQPLYALQPGLVEEIWARLFLTTLLYALLRPLSKAAPRRALTTSMILATLIHGLAHFPGSISNPIEAVFIAVVYGLPLVLLYVKRDFEHALAYHFFIDFVRFAAYVIQV